MSNQIFLHICKTGGTALKYLSKENKARLGFNIAKVHNTTLTNCNGRAIFGIRDPWERFCSGYWERATMTLRRDYYHQHMKDKEVASFGYSNLRQEESALIAAHPTPNALITHWREAKIGWGNRQMNIPLWELLAPITRWTGNLQSYKENEHRVELVYEVSNMSKIFLDLYNVAMPEDPFFRRSRQLFGIEQSYHITTENLVWFREVFRAEDYELIKYIRGRPYYRSGNT